MSVVFSRHHAVMMISDFSALTMRLPSLDTATLSQAWRDALHQTALRPKPARNGAVKMTPFRPVPTQIAQGQGRVTPMPGKGGTLPVLHSAHTKMTRAEEDRPIVKIRTRQATIHMQAHSARLLKRETFVMNMPNGERICLLVAPIGSGMHITVLCAPHVQADMQRALSLLAQSLASQSIALHVAPFAEVS